MKRFRSVSYSVGNCHGQYVSFVMLGAVVKMEEIPVLLPQWGRLKEGWLMGSDGTQGCCCEEGPEGPSQPPGV